MNIPVIVPVKISTTATTIPVTVKTDVLQDVTFGYSVNFVGAEPYDGPYQYTPTMEEQIVPIYNKRATQDIVIDPIPSNYGLITWNGSVLTVS